MGEEGERGTTERDKEDCMDLTACSGVSDPWMEYVVDNEAGAEGVEEAAEGGLSEVEARLEFGHQMGREILGSGGDGLGVSVAQEGAAPRVPCRRCL